MAKGDREKLKADPDDGVTKIAHLLLEALAMSTLSGAEKGLVLFLWRRTYGWMDRETGEPFKDDTITLQEWAAAIDSCPSCASKLLKKLIETHNVILRTEYSPGRTPRYQMNTLVETWRGCLNVQGLYECARQGLYKSARVGLHKSARVDTASEQSQSAFQPPLNLTSNLTVNLASEQGSPDKIAAAMAAADAEMAENDPLKPQVEELVKLLRQKFPLQDKLKERGAAKAYEEFHAGLLSGYTFEEYKAAIQESTEQDMAPWDVTKAVKGRRRARSPDRSAPDRASPDGIPNSGAYTQDDIRTWRWTVDHPDDYTPAKVKDARRKLEAAERQRSGTG